MLLTSRSVGLLHDDHSDTSMRVRTLLTEEAAATIPALKEVPETLWAKHKYDVGLTGNRDPVAITPKSSYRPC